MQARLVCSCSRFYPGGCLVRQLHRRIRTPTPANTPFRPHRALQTHAPPAHQHAHPAHKYSRTTTPTEAKPPIAGKTFLGPLGW